MVSSFIYHYLCIASGLYCIAIGVYGIARDNDILQTKILVHMYFLIHIILHHDASRAVITVLRVVHIASRGILIVPVFFKQILTL